MFVIYEVMHNELIRAEEATGETVTHDQRGNPIKPTELLRRAIGIFEVEDEAEHWSITLQAAARDAGESAFWDFPVEELEVDDRTKVEVLIEDFAQMGT